MKRPTSFRNLLAAGVFCILPIAAQAQIPIRIAVIDSGIADTKALGASLESEFDMVSGRSPYSTKNNHGTAVSTVIVQASHRAVRIISLRTDIDGKCDETVCQLDTNAVANAVRKAIEMKVDIINMSLVRDYNAAFYNLLKIASDAGIKMVMAAGNRKIESRGLLYAKLLPHTLWLVGAKDEQGQHAGFSAHSSRADCACQFVWRRGVNVQTQDRYGKSIAVNGTSFAAPLMAAELAQGPVILASR